MLRRDYKIRNSIQYKIQMWFYRLTFRDVKHAAKNTQIIIGEIIIAILGIIMLFIFPALFH